jgi:WD repeat-containing protein 61
MFTTTRKVTNAHNDAIWCVNWTRNRIITAGLDGHVHIKDNQHEPVHSFSNDLAVTSLSSNQSITAATLMDSTIKIYDHADYSTKTIDAGPLEAWCCALTNDSQYVITGTHLGKVNFWSVESAQRMSSVDLAKGKMISSLAINGNTLAATSENGWIYLFDITSGKVLHSISGKGEIN